MAGSTSWWTKRRVAVLSSELGQRQRSGDRAIGLAVADQADVAAGHLDAVGAGDDAALPAHDAVALRVDARQPDPVVREGAAEGAAVTAVAVRTQARLGVRAAGGAPGPARAAP